MPSRVDQLEVIPSLAASEAVLTTGTVTSNCAWQPKPLDQSEDGRDHDERSRVEEIMPPIIGTAMRCMISDPVPVLHMIGSRPAMMAVTVIIFGRTRSTAPSMMAS
jgi:hypothetical protein